jgi:hypothetical protein
LPDNERVHFSIPSDEPIHPIILAAKAVVLQTSTVGLEAYVAGKPVVSLEHSPSVKKYYSLANMGISTPCYSTQDLPSVLEKVMSNTADAAKHYTNDGRSAERVADVITAALGL